MLALCHFGEEDVEHGAKRIWLLDIGDMRSVLDDLEDSVGNGILYHLGAGDRSRRILPADDYLSTHRTPASSSSRSRRIGARQQPMKPAAGAALTRPRIPSMVSGLAL